LFKKQEKGERTTGPEVKRQATVELKLKQKKTRWLKNFINIFYIAD